MSTESPLPSSDRRAPMLPVSEALEIVLGLAEPVGAELVPITEADGRVLRESVVSRRTQPPFDAAQMDGYAVRSADAAEGAQLQVIGEIAAGDPGAIAVGPGQAARIFTGAPMPEGADAVLLQEDVERDGETARVGEAVAKGQWVRPAGHDFSQGAALLSAPRRLTPADVALAAAMGVSWLTVARRPRIALLALGDELRLPGDPLGPGQIVSTNNFGVAALVRRQGAETTLAPLAPDDLDATRAALRAHAGCDVIVTLGGASDGDHDLSRPAFAAEGATPDFYKIAMRPGKPLMAGRMGRAAMVGLPGNPVSAMVCAHLFLRPLVDALLGLPAGPAPRRRLPLAEPLGANGPREHYMRAETVETEAGPAVRAFPDQDSALLSVLARADALLVRPAHDPARAAGEMVELIMI